MRLIDADKLIERCDIEATGGESFWRVMWQEFAKTVKDMPTVEAEPVRHGRWVETDETEEFYGFLSQCTNCGKLSLVYDNDPEVPEYGATHYCPNCGAKMDEEEKDCERCLQVTERPGNDICKACGGRRGQDASRVEKDDLRDMRE